ncbi:MAG: hypothetical protein HY821_14615 [Acidobacteria bacterium]|nr:hypothetical protein [Acidobacteriota bacterium]
MQTLVRTLALLVPALLAPAQTISVTLPAAQATKPLDGRLLILFSTDPKAEPRFQIGDGLNTQIVFGQDVDNWKPGTPLAFDRSSPGYPISNVKDLRPGEYTVQAVLDLYETFHFADGRTLKLPTDRGEGRQWSRAPGNLYSKPVQVTVGPDAQIALALDSVMPPIEPLKDTKYIKHIRIQSELLSKFWGRPMFLGAHILVPEGFDTHPEARYPLAIFHGHFPADFGGFRTEPPDPNLKPTYSARFRMNGLNVIQQQEAYDFYRKWTSPGFPRFLIVEIQHANPYYDDSYAVNSANLGPYGDAIMKELVPEIERRFRGIGQGWARFTYGGSTGGWEALAVQIFYPEEFNGAFGACPDPIDFRAYTQINLYDDHNAYYLEGPHTKVARPGARDYLGKVTVTVEQMNRLELALGTRTRSGQQFDIWEAVYSPIGPDGYPARIFDKATGVIDKKVAAYWKENFDLRYILERDWAKLGPKLQGKLHIYCGDMDTYYLNNAVYLMEDFLKSANTPKADATVAYGDRAEHCWNGDPKLPNGISRLRYNTMFLPRMLERMEANHPPGADLKSWRY